MDGAEFSTGNFYVSEYHQVTVEGRHLQIYPPSCKWNEYTCNWFRRDKPCAVRLKLMVMRNKSHLGIKALASSAVSGHKLAKHASSNLWSFFLPSKLQQEIHVQKKQALQPILVFFSFKNRVEASLKLWLEVWETSVDKWWWETTGSTQYIKRKQNLHKCIVNRICTKNSDFFYIVKQIRS